METLMTRSLAAIVIVMLSAPISAKDIAPDFSLRTPGGERLHLQDLLEEGPVLLDFCPTFAHIAGADECGTEGVGAVLQGQSRGCKSSRARSIH